MYKIFRWFKYLWRLRVIFDEYIPKIGGCVSTIEWQQRAIENLRQANIDLEKEVKKLKKELEGEPIPVDEPPKVTKVDKYYDPQMGVEYCSFEINGEKGSPDEDTVKE